MIGCEPRATEAGRAAGCAHTLAVTVGVLISGCAPTSSPPAPPEPSAEPAAHAPGRVPPAGPYAPGFDALHYQIAVDVPAEGSSFNGRTRIHIALLEPRRDTLRLDLTGLRVLSAALSIGRAQPSPVSFRQHDGRIFLTLPANARAGDTLIVDIAYAGTPDDGLILRPNVHGDRGAFADNWPDRARFWFPSIDHPSDKATAEFEVRAPPGWEVVANGIRVGSGAAPSGTAAADVWRYTMREPIPTYLMVIGATDFAIGRVSDCAEGGRTAQRSDGCVPVGYWVFPRDSADAARIFRRAGDMVSHYARLFAPFPYTHLEHVQSATRFGGMENATVIFYSERAIANGSLSEVTVAHETVHQWFGDAVTPGRWNDLWLSEGFATYFGMQYFEAADGAERFRELREGSWSGYVRSAVTGIPIVDTARVPDNDLLSLLNANSYQKGGAVLHMLRGLLGDDVFFRGIRRYYERHVHGTALTGDLRRALEEASGKDLGWFFHQWVYKPGHPILAVRHMWDAARSTVVVTIDQVQPIAWPVFRMPLTLDLVTGTGTQRHTVEMTERRTVATIPLRAAPSAIRVDPDGWLLKELEPGS